MRPPVTFWQAVAPLRAQYLADAIADVEQWVDAEGAAAERAFASVVLDWLRLTPADQDVLRMHAQDRLAETLDRPEAPAKLGLLAELQRAVSEDRFLAPPGRP